MKRVVTPSRDAQRRIGVLVKISLEPRVGIGTHTCPGELVMKPTDKI